MLRPVEVRALPPHGLWVRYADGVEGEIDLSHLVGRGVFALWEDPLAFERVSIGSAGQIAWSDAMELCADAVYIEITGKTPQDVFPKLKTEAVGA